MKWLNSACRRSFTARCHFSISSFIMHAVLFTRMAVKPQLGNKQSRWPPIIIIQQETLHPPTLPSKHSLCFESDRGPGFRLHTSIKVSDVQLFWRRRERSFSQKRLLRCCQSSAGPGGSATRERLSAAHRQFKVNQCTSSNIDNGMISHCFQQCGVHVRLVFKGMNITFEWAL